VREQVVVQKPLVFRKQAPHELPTCDIVVKVWSARAHTHTDTRANASPSLSLPNPYPFSLLLPDQGVEGRAQGRVRGRCGLGTRTAATADQMRVLRILMQLAVAADWRGVVAQERAARAVAAAMRTSMPGSASAVY
jgi:hypothetical protein